MSRFTYHRTKIAPPTEVITPSTDKNFIILVRDQRFEVSKELLAKKCFYFAELLERRKKVQGNVFVELNELDPMVLDLILRNCVYGEVLSKDDLEKYEKDLEVAAIKFKLTTLKQLIINKRIIKKRIIKHHCPKCAKTIARIRKFSKIVDQFETANEEWRERFLETNFNLRLQLRFKIAQKSAEIIEDLVRENCSMFGSFSFCVLCVGLILYFCLCLLMLQNLGFGTDIYRTDSFLCLLSIVLFIGFVYFP